MSPSGTWVSRLGTVPALSDALAAAELLLAQIAYAGGGERVRLRDLLS